MHDLAFSLPGFVALLASCFVFRRPFAARGERGWAAYSALTGLVLAIAGFGLTESLVELAWLLRRVAVAAGWLASLATL